MTNVQEFLQKIYDELVKDSDEDFEASKEKQAFGMEKWHSGASSRSSAMARYLESMASSQLGVYLKTTKTKFSENTEKFEKECRESLNQSNN